MHKHSEFIFSPILNVLKEAITATAGIGNSIEVFPVSDYIMQSVFLKMTGFQEQKMKCIQWELATNDLEYRYNFTKKIVGECSSLSEKENIYQDLISHIKKRIPYTHNDIKKEDLLAETYLNIEEVFRETNLLISAQKAFVEYGNIWKEIHFKEVAYNEKVLFPPNDIKSKRKNDPTFLLVKIHSYLYKRRNKIAHNTQSYQQNLPLLQRLVQEDYRYNNYFIWFSTLVLIDAVFIELYKRYLTSIDETTF